MFNFPEVSEDLRYHFNKTPLAMPWSTSADAMSGLKITLKRRRDYSSGLAEQCNYENFIIHDPFEQPMSSDGLVFDYGMSLDVLISVDAIKSDENLRDIDLSKRNCYFEDERKLKFFKVYTKLNCERECRSLFTFDSCGCVPFFLVRNQTMKICGIAGTECAKHFELFDRLNITDLDMCNCLPTCDLVTYNYDIISTSYNKKFNEK